MVGTELPLLADKTLMRLTEMVINLFDLTVSFVAFGLHGIPMALSENGHFLLLNNVSQDLRARILEYYEYFYSSSQSLEDRAAYLEKYGPADEVTRGLPAVSAEEEEYYYFAEGAGYDAGYVDDVWSQQYDENAQAYYFFNSATGEASWTDPYG